MAISRKDALRRLNGLVHELETHLNKLAREPNCQAATHWIHEIQTFLNGIEEMLPHVGRRTSRDWSDKIAEWRRLLEKLCLE